MLFGLTSSPLFRGQQGWTPSSPALCDASELRGNLQVGILMLVQSLRDAPLPGCEHFSFSELCEEYACALGREDETCVFTLTCASGIVHAPPAVWTGVARPVVLDSSILTSVRKPFRCQSLSSYPVLGLSVVSPLRLSH